MTFVEFFDVALIENICSALTNPPDRIVLLGDKKALLLSQAERYAEILHDRGADVEFVTVHVNRNNISEIIEALSNIVEDYSDCVFDLTGGEGTFLVAAGIIFERFKDKNIQMHRFNIANNTIQDCDLDKNTILKSELPKLTVQENIRLYGGNIIYDDVRPGATPRWEVDENFARHVDIMWDICKENPGKWNTQLFVFNAAELLKDPSEKELDATVPVNSLKAYLEQNGRQLVLFKDILDKLRFHALINYSDDGRFFKIHYKNSQVKKCLLKSGLVLEMKIYITALQIKEKDGSLTYNDVMNGVCIDWNGDDENPMGHETENEIDVMMMKGMVPVFVSCKNGMYDKEELYKLNTVATRFGGKYAKKVLVASTLDNITDAEKSFRARASEMKIHILDKRICEMTDDELQKKLKSYWTLTEYKQ